MTIFTKNLLACALATSALCGAVARADVPDAEMKLSATALKTNQVLSVTFSSKVPCSIQMEVIGLDDSAQTQSKPPQYLKTFTPPEQYQFTFPKAGNYRVWAHSKDNTTCGNMKNVMMSQDIVVTAPILIASMATDTLVSANPVVASPRPSPSAEGPPVVVGISASPSAVTVGTDVKFTVPLTGNIVDCIVAVNWGDGGGIPMTHIYKNVMPAMKYIHKYGSPGTYLATVSPISGCTGGGRVEVKVSGSPVGGNPTTPPIGNPTTPPIGKLTGLSISGSTLTAAPATFKTTDELSATVQGVAGGKCGLLVTSTATSAQPTAFSTDAANPYPVTKKFIGLKPGTQTVTATPTAYLDFPACQGAPITVSFTVK